MKIREHMSHQSINYGSNSGVTGWQLKLETRPDKPCGFLACSLAIAILRYNGYSSITTAVRMIGYNKRSDFSPDREHMASSLSYQCWKLLLVEFSQMRSLVWSGIFNAYKWYWIYSLSAVHSPSPLTCWVYRIRLKTAMRLPGDWLSLGRADSSN